MNYQNELWQAINKVYQNHASISWVGLFGNATINYSTEIKPEKILYTLTYANDEIKAFDSEGKEINITISQELQDTTATEVNRPAKQPSAKSRVK